MEREGVPARIGWPANESGRRGGGPVSLYVIAWGQGIVRSPAIPWHAKWY